MPLLKTVTLGCKVNQYETEYVRQGLARLGYREAAPGETPDLCLVNTCAVTTEGEAKSRKLIRRLAQDFPGMGVIVMGCYATRAPHEVARLPGIVEVVTDKRELPDLLARWGVEDVPTGIADFPDRRRAMVKVQDGCRTGCSYCIIPLVRPVLWSRPASDVRDEVRRLLSAGHREIVLTGVHLGHYGVDDGAGSMPELAQHSTARPLRERGRGEGAFTLAELVQQVLDLPDDFRLRLSSIEAAEVTPELLRVMAAAPERACPHLHLPLQSGADSVLRRMRRRYDLAEFQERCAAIRAALDRPALTTDLMVGFPGETDAEFEATCRAVEAIGFAQCHIFRYSPRPGTAAASLPRPVLDRLKNQRVDQLERVARDARQRFLESLVNRPARVLLETPLPDRPGWMLGTCDRYAPVEVAAPNSARGQFVLAAPQSIDRQRLIAGGNVGCRM